MVKAARTSSDLMTGISAPKTKQVAPPGLASPITRPTAIDLQIKMAQGAKPGERGQPGAQGVPLRPRSGHPTPGVGLISPPPYHDIYPLRIWRSQPHLKNANPSRAGTRQAGLRKRGRDGCGWRFQSPRRRGLDFRARWWHRRDPADIGMKHAGAPWSWVYTADVAAQRVTDRIVVQVTVS